MTDSVFMLKALELASQAALDGEIPVGAVIVRGGQVVGTGRNRRECSKNALAHAEIEAINEACKSTGSWRLSDCELYVTLEPCPMCTGAIINARLKRVIFGAYNGKAGSCVSVTALFDLPFNHRPQIIGGYMENECAKVLTNFFRQLRPEETI